MCQTEIEYKWNAIEKLLDAVESKAANAVSSFSSLLQEDFLLVLILPNNDDTVCLCLPGATC